MPSRHRADAVRNALRNWRMLPGQEYSINLANASSSIRTQSCPAFSSRSNVRIRSALSPRSRSRGRCSVMPFSR